MTRGAGERAWPARGVEGDEYTGIWSERVGLVGVAGSERVGAVDEVGLDELVLLMGETVALLEWTLASGNGTAQSEDWMALSWNWMAWPLGMPVITRERER